MGMMIDQEVIDAAEYARSVGQTPAQWVDELQYQTNQNPAYDKWEAAINIVIDDVSERPLGWPEVLARLQNVQDRS